MIDKAHLTTKARINGAAWQSPPSKRKVYPQRPEGPKESFQRSKQEGTSWGKIAALSLLGLGAVAGGAAMIHQPAPAEVALETEAIATPEELSISLEKNSETGISAVPSDWIPAGESRAYAESPFGVAQGTTTRGTKQIKLDLDGKWDPDLTLTDLGDGKVQAFVDLPGPFDQKSEGYLTREGDVLTYESESGDTSATFKKSEDGSIQATLKRDGWSEWNLSYKGY